MRHAQGDADAAARAGVRRNPLRRVPDPARATDRPGRTGSRPGPDHAGDHPGGGRRPDRRRGARPGAGGQFPNGLAAPGGAAAPRAPGAPARGHHGPPCPGDAPGVPRPTGRPTPPVPLHHPQPTGAAGHRPAVRLACAGPARCRGDAGGLPVSHWHSRLRRLRRSEQRAARSADRTNGLPGRPLAGAGGGHLRDRGQRLPAADGADHRGDAGRDRAGPA